MCSSASETPSRPVGSIAAWSASIVSSSAEMSESTTFSGCSDHSSVQLLDRLFDVERFFFLGHAGRYGVRLRAPRYGRVRSGA